MRGKPLELPIRAIYRKGPNIDSHIVYLSRAMDIG